MRYKTKKIFIIDNVRIKLTTVSEEHTTANACQQCQYTQYIKKCHSQINLLKRNFETLVTFHLMLVHIILVRFGLLSDHLLEKSCPLGSGDHVFSLYMFFDYL